MDEMAIARIIEFIQKEDIKANESQGKSNEFVIEVIPESEVTSNTICFFVKLNDKVDKSEIARVLERELEPEEKFKKNENLALVIRKP